MEPSRGRIATASRIAARFANSYAGALPKEAMGETATRILLKRFVHKA